MAGVGRRGVAGRERGNISRGRRNSEKQGVQGRAGQGEAGKVCHDPVVDCDKVGHTGAGWAG